MKTQKILLILIACIFCISAGQAAGVIRIYMSPTGNDANSGASWASPKRTLEAVSKTLNNKYGNVRDVSDDVQIWMKAGTYQTVDHLTFYANSAYSVFLYGGFRGTEQKADERDGKAATIIDCSTSGISFQSFDSRQNPEKFRKAILVDAITFTGTNTFALNTGERSIISIKNCAFDTLKARENDRGSILSLSNSPTIFENCSFKNCSGEIFLLGRNGYVASMLGTNFENCRVTLHYEGPQWKIENCNFIDNGKNWYSTLIDARQSGFLRLVGCTFKNNESRGTMIESYPSGGDLSKSGIYVEKCTFEGNTATNSAGILSLYNNGKYMMVKESTFENNTAEGLAVVVSNCEQATHIFEKCIFKNNHTTRATPNSDTAGAISVPTRDTTVLSVDGCTFEGNTAGQ